MSEQLEYAVEMRVDSFTGPATWRLITDWCPDKLTAKMNVGYIYSHRTLRLVARRPASQHWVVEA